MRRPRRTLENSYATCSQKESYFETVGRPSLLQHLWSLAIEEQFYVLWPLLFAVGSEQHEQAALEWAET